METEKLYYQDPYQTTFTARVLTCEPSKGGCLVTLDPVSYTHLTLPTTPYV